MKKILKPILVVGGVGSLGTGIVFGALEINKKIGNNDKNDKKLVEDVKELLQDLSSDEKQIIISATSGTIDENKEEILKKLKESINFNSLNRYTDVELSVSPNQMTKLKVNSWETFQITIKKRAYTLEFDNEFEVKRSSTELEINEDISTVKKDLSNFSTKEITIITNTGTIESNKKEILNALQKIREYKFLDLKGTTISISPNQITTLTRLGVTFKIMISKTGGSPQEITTGFIVKKN